MNEGLIQKEVMRMNNSAVIAVNPHPDDMYGVSKRPAVVSVAIRKDEDKYRAVRMHMKKPSELITRLFASFGQLYRFLT